IKKFKANIGKVKNNGMKKESCPMVDVSDLKNKQNKLNGKISSDKKRLAIYRKFHRDFHKLFFLKGEFTTGGTILGFMSFGLLVGGLVVGSLGGAVAGLVLLGSATATMVYNGLISFDAFRIEDRLEESIRTKTAELEKIEQTLVGFENASTTVPQRNIKHEKTQNLAKKAAKRKVVTEESVLESEEDFNVDNPFSV
ncbi:MAG: hypothetical protein IJA72_03925, partial [Clostridia bacterium]|nr:hypothetical protein [Clostridia bacterium]